MSPLSTAVAEGLGPTQEEEPEAVLLQVLPQCTTLIYMTQTFLPKYLCDCTYVAPEYFSQLL